MKIISRKAGSLSKHAAKSANRVSVPIVFWIVWEAVVKLGNSISQPTWHQKREKKKKKKRRNKVKFPIKI